MHSKNLTHFLANKKSLLICDSPPNPSKFSETSEKLFFSFLSQYVVVSETHTKKQAIQHDCLPSLLGDADK
jgi:hypothetical protein